MVLPLYLAMTAAEMGTNTAYPDYFAFMACHFSPYGPGLSNLPKDLPTGSMLILNDRIPWEGHHIPSVVTQLLDIVAEKRCSSVLLDFQRPGADAIPHLTKNILDALPCPVGISHLYAGAFSCPVFLPPVPLDIPLADHIAPWLEREIWLEAALDGCVITLSEEGSHTMPLPHPSLDSGHKNDTLHCHYTIETSADTARFTLCRTEEDLSDLLEEAQSLGITRSVGLWQELKKT